MTTDPYTGDTPDLLTRSLTHTMAARCVLPDGETFRLDVERARVGFDSTRAPRVIASLSCRVPTDDAQLSRIDPRTGARIEIDAGYIRPGGLRDIHPLVDLGLRRRPVARPDDTMELEAHSDEALVIDDAPRLGGAFTRSTTTGAITAMLTDVFGMGLTPTVTSTTGPAVTQGPYEDRWDLVLDLADRIGARVYDDGMRGWWIAPAPVLTTPTLLLQVGQYGTVPSSDSELSRDDEWANQVFLRYRWRDTSDVEHTISATRRITTGPYAAVAGNIKSRLIERAVSTTQAEANAAAASLVARTVTRGASLTLRAISAYWLRPGHTVTVQLPTGLAQDHLVESVEFDLLDGSMDVTTRLPDNTGTIGA